MAPLRRKSQRKNPPARAASSSSTPIHPPYFQMISEALTSLKDRSGSSQAAIAKFLQEKYGEQLPPKFDKILTAQLKKSVNSQKIVKIRNSYKICPSEKKKKVTEDDDSGESESDSEEAPAGKKMKELGEVKTPEAKGRMKPLSQIHTPDALKSKKKKRKV